VLTEDQRAALIHAVDRLGDDVGGAGPTEAPAECSGLGDEQFILAMRRSLARIAAALDGDETRMASEPSVIAALDATEMVIRGELTIGNSGRLPTLLPAIVFLVTIPVVDRDRALALSKRCSQLLEQS
jgi:hypothetical protein